MATPQASMGMRSRAPSPSSTPPPGPTDLRNYKCVPLDLLRNVQEDGQGEYSIALASDAPTLKDFKEQQAADLRAAGPLIGGTLSADAVENILVTVLILSPFKSDMKVCPLG